MRWRRVIAGGAAGMGRVYRVPAGRARRRARAHAGPDHPCSLRACAISGIAALHARFYAERHGFGALFEAKAARKFNEFLAHVGSTRGDPFRCAMDRHAHGIRSVFYPLARSQSLSGLGCIGPKHRRFVQSAECSQGRFESSSFPSVR